MLDVWLGSVWELSDAMRSLLTRILVTLFPLRGISVLPGGPRRSCFRLSEHWSLEVFVGSVAVRRRSDRRAQPHVGIAKAVVAEGGSFLRLAAVVFSLLLNGGRLLDRSYAGVATSLGPPPKTHSVCVRADRVGLTAGFGS